MSIGTVDRVLHNRGEVAEETREKINRIVEELHYRPNLLASSLASKKTVQFATLLPEPPSPEGYWNKPFVGIRKRISEIRQYGIDLQQFTFNQSSPASFRDQTDKIIKLRPDGVVLAPFFLKESLQFISSLKENHIPFVFIDSEIRDAGHLSYIGQNSFQSGLVSAKLIDLLTPGGGGILVLHFAKEMDNQNHLIQREKGFYEWFRNRRQEYRLFTLEIPDMENDGWMERVLNKIRKENIKGLFVTNSKVFYACQLIRKYNLNDIKVIGHDLLKENVAFLHDGTLDFLICQRPEEQGYNAINKLFMHIVQKSEVKSENYTSIDIVTKETVDFYKEF